MYLRNGQRDDQKAAHEEIAPASVPHALGQPFSEPIAHAAEPTDHPQSA
ncbi:hypothetical protein BSTEL_1526 [Bifidobacterium stellenboschense]|uniref:Uncharacterized protein n=1 Tax=Bifidobacterium stellenboschense TaxID=762211 RepID=A0A087DIR5_9BIFI|nr:hypothetical protein BSTEL_1526 [Bifidobacterium stellenboschense]